jgi:RNA polymerase-binding transcription factor DksA
MSDADLKRYRETLLALGRRLRGEEEEFSEEALRPSGALAEGSTINARGDAGDVSVDSSSQDVSLGLMANERQLFAQVTAALQRIDQGMFGKCVVCGREIAKERLEVLPYTPYCLEDARQTQNRFGPVSTEGTTGVA